MSLLLSARTLTPGPVPATPHTSEHAESSRVSSFHCALLLLAAAPSVPCTASANILLPACKDSAHLASCFPCTVPLPRLAPTVPAQHEPTKKRPAALSTQHPILLHHAPSLHFWPCSVHPVCKAPAKHQHEQASEHSTASLISAGVLTDEQHAQAAQREQRSTQGSHASRPTLEHRRCPPEPAASFLLAHVPLSPHAVCTS